MEVTVYKRVLSARPVVPGSVDPARGDISEHTVGGQAVPVATVGPLFSPSTTTIGGGPGQESDDNWLEVAEPVAKLVTSLIDRLGPTPRLIDQGFWIVFDLSRGVGEILKKTRAPGEDKTGVLTEILRLCSTAVNGVATLSGSGGLQIAATAIGIITEQPEYPAVLQLHLAVPGNKWLETPIEVLEALSKKTRYATSVECVAREKEGVPKSTEPSSTSAALLGSNLGGILEAFPRIPFIAQIRGETYGGSVTLDASDIASFQLFYRPQSAEPLGSVASAATPSADALQPSKSPPSST